MISSNGLRRPRGEIQYSFGSVGAGGTGVEISAFCAYARLEPGGGISSRQMRSIVEPAYSDGTARSWGVMLIACEGGTKSLQ
jgi:hypothetical protein